mmetsp:Transcript_3446/g.10153  ORF Transcript_3446/g.10153 Transcript_3446/m.10153 type:complete len:203 (+) Transcript_3446:202-810(+)
MASAPKKLSFSQEVVKKQDDKENMQFLASAFGGSFGGLVSPGSYLRARGPPRYGEAPATPGALAQDAPASRWTPTGRPSTDSRDDDDDELMDEDDELEGDDGGGGGGTPEGGLARLSRESLGMFLRQQEAIDAAGPASAIKIIKSVPDERTPVVPRYVTSYAETPLSGESRCSEWVPRSRSPHGSHRRGGAGESDDDDDDDV